jgi:hypothetical protein
MKNYLTRKRKTGHSPGLATFNFPDYGAYAHFHCVPISKMSINAFFAHFLAGFVLKLSRRSRFLQISP